MSRSPESEGRFVFVEFDSVKMSSESVFFFSEDIFLFSEKNCPLSDSPLSLFFSSAGKGHSGRVKFFLACKPCMFAIL